MGIAPRNALLGQLELIAAREPLTSYFELRIRLPRGRMEQVFVPLPELERAAMIGLNRGQLSDVYVGVAPRVTPSGTVEAIERVGCLWADVDGAEALARLRRFEPRPTLVVRSGSADSVHAHWSLSHPLRPAHLRRANRRLAHEVGADRKATDAARILRAAGTFNHKHDPPGRAPACHPAVWQRDPPTEASRAHVTP